MPDRVYHVWATRPRVQRVLETLFESMGMFDIEFSTVNGGFAAFNLGVYVRGVISEGEGYQCWVEVSATDDYLSREHTPLTFVQALVGRRPYLRCEELLRILDEKLIATILRTRRIFISYRRSDSAEIVGRIYEQLIQSFPQQSVFRDINTIPLGVDFRAHLGQALSDCDIGLVIIGSQWLSVTTEEGKRRIDDPEDFVRLEVEGLLSRRIPVIPVLVNGAAMPKPNQLPESIADLALRNGVEIRSDPDFQNAMQRLLDSLSVELESVEGRSRRVEHG